MPATKTLEALAKVVAALAPLTPEERRQVVEATHALLPVGAGRQGKDRPGPRRGKGRR